MKRLFLGLMGVCVLSACAPKQDGGSVLPLDGKALAEQFLKPSDGKAESGVLFDKNGNVVAVVSADGSIAKSCRLPKPDRAENEKAAAETTTDAAQLPLCHGSTDTTIYGVSQVTVVSHKGSYCKLYYSPPGSYLQLCIPPK